MQGVANKFNSLLFSSPSFLQLVVVVVSLQLHSVVQFAGIFSFFFFFFKSYLKLTLNLILVTDLFVFVWNLKETTTTTTTTTTNYIYFYSKSNQQTETGFMRSVQYLAWATRLKTEKKEQFLQNPTEPNKINDQSLTWLEKCKNKQKKRRKK